jgi:4-hydroxythreonine-4-phosphate dehydrogenase
MRPTVGLLLGDACGIGPELAAKLLAEPATLPDARIVVLGDPRLLAAGAERAGVALALPLADDAPAGHDGPVLRPGPVVDPAALPVGEASAEAGRAVLDSLRAAVELAQAGELDALCFAPLNKQAMHLGGLVQEDELRFLAALFGVTGEVGEINATLGLATTRVTSHVPLRAVADLITEASVLAAIRLAHDTLRAAGKAAPRIAVCGLNPHAGDGGVFGHEEIAAIAPAVQAAQRRQIAVSGPYPSDTVFLRARDGAFDAVVTMYHDQGQIAMKLMGFEQGITILAGLPIPVTTAAHGTAFDIVGRRLARPDALRQALHMATAMAAGGR